MNTWRTSLTVALSHAQSGQFAEMLATCQQIIESQQEDPATLLQVGTLLLNFGYLSQARDCFERVLALAPNDPQPLVNLANLARDAGDHAKSKHCYATLQTAQPNNPVVRRNWLVSQEYDPSTTDLERLQHASAWGEWAIRQMGGWKPRPTQKALEGRPLRVGYVSADLCQHTVGLFVKDVLKEHDSAQVTVFAYYAGQTSDWVTDTIRLICTLRNIATLDDIALADLIRNDEIDVLVDLSGHTAGSRLTVFAHRPAPVQVSWLGYFATTGLSYIDAVLLDDWHAPIGAEKQFIEPIIRLPTGRLCYQPVPWAPAEVAPLPCLKNGYITFGCFNNTSKLNDGVFDVWAGVMAAVPSSRLLLKWRTLADDNLCDSIRAALATRGITPERIELRPASFHSDLLTQYADIDIALDPFPFTGGMTTCEALWMGVPVVTWPQSRIVSRQSFAFLSTIGLPELAAADAHDYVRIAESLTSDLDRLGRLRSSMRSRMLASPLMDVAGLTRELENTLRQLYIEKQTERAISIKTILHVGPGHKNNGAMLPVVFQTTEWKELRIDIDEANEPDIVGSMLDMKGVADASAEAIYSAHNIEHVYAYEVPLVLKEFLRVLKPAGFLVVTCPDLQAVCQLVAEDKLTDAAYQSPAGPITPLDILYGHGAALAAGHHYMAHKCGFTLRTLTQALHSAGFATTAGMRRPRGLDLWVVATKSPMEEGELRELAGKVFPG